MYMYKRLVYLSLKYDQLCLHQSFPLNWSQLPRNASKLDKKLYLINVEY